MDAEERALFREALRQVMNTRSAEQLDKGLEAVGWREALRADRRAAIAAVFEIQGRLNATSPALDAVLADALGFEDDTVGCVVLPTLGSSEAPGGVVRDRVCVHGIATRAVAGQSSVCVVSNAADGYGCAILSPGELSSSRLNGMDPDLALSEVTGDIRATVLAPIGSPGAWGRAMEVGRLALSHELLGASRAMLALACDHARERVQFGRTISAFQAVRHRLAESLVAIEGADAALAAAWDEPSALSASVAKALAGRAALSVARHCQQVLAGMGFTIEHPFHRYLRRVLVLDQILGSSPSLLKETGEELLTGRVLPPANPL